MAPLPRFSERNFSLPQTRRVPSGLAPVPPARPIAAGAPSNPICAATGRTFVQTAPALSRTPITPAARPEASTSGASAYRTLKTPSGTLLRLLVDRQQVDRLAAVLRARPRVRARRLESGVPEELCGDHEVGATAHQRRRERMPQHMGGHMVIQPRPRSDARDHLVRAPRTQTAAAAI